MKLVITGAMGHIGSSLIRELPKFFEGLSVTMIDSLLTQRYSSLFDLPDSISFKFIEADVTKIDLIQIFTGVDVVVHLAAITDAAGSFDKADIVEANNLKATELVAKACAKSGAKLIALSSTSVYGTQDEIVSEDCAEGNLKPQSPYAVTKLKEERLVMDLCKNSGLRAAICRFGTIFGTSPGMRFHTAVNKFCWQAVMKQPVTVWSTAYNQRRPYLDLQDAISALCFIIENDLFDGEIYNVLTVNATVQEIVGLIKKRINSLKVSFVDSQIMNQLSYEVSQKKFKDKGFKYQGSIELGISKTIDLLKNANA